jgi:hypothetical protein
VVELVYGALLVSHGILIVPLILLSLVKLGLEELDVVLNMGPVLVVAGPVGVAVGEDNVESKTGPVVDASVVLGKIVVELRNGAVVGNTEDKGPVPDELIVKVVSTDDVVVLAKGGDDDVVELSGTVPVENIGAVPEPVVGKGGAVPVLQDTIGAVPELQDMTGAVPELVVGNGGAVPEVQIVAVPEMVGVEVVDSSSHGVVLLFVYGGVILDGRGVSELGPVVVSGTVPEEKTPELQGKEDVGLLVGELVRGTVPDEVIPELHGNVGLLAG